MWTLVLLLDLLGRKNFLRLLAGWMLIMAFLLYCFVHEAFDRPRPVQTVAVPNAERQVEPVRAWTSTPKH
jgi:hypothetical protein